MDFSQLLDLELIRQLKYRYMRAVDTHDVDLARSCFAKRVRASYSNDQYVVEGREELCALISSLIDQTTGSSHIAVHPEIRFDGPDRASAIWRLEDTVHYTQPQPAIRHLAIVGGEELQGAGHYYDEYVREEGEWKISYTSYERLYERVATLGGHVSVMEKGHGTSTPDARSAQVVSHKVRMSHFGICVSDLDRALCFYCDGLGFSDNGGIQLADQCGNVLGLDSFELQTRMLSLNGQAIELLHFPRSHGPVFADNLRPMNHTGLTHIALAVEDLDGTVQSIVAHGGRAFAETRATLPSPNGPITLQYCADPDHTRIELIRYPSNNEASDGREAI